MSVANVASPVDAEVRLHLGRPTVFINGVATALPMYSPITWRPGFLQKSGPGFFQHKMGAYMIGLPQAADGKEWGESPLWDGDTITDKPTRAFKVDIDAQANYILENDPGAYLFVRNAPSADPQWNRLHPDQMFVNEAGERFKIPSMASDAYWDCCARVMAASVRYCEGRAWGHRIIGYWYGLEHEGTYFPLFDGWLFDHSQLMRERWRTWLRAKYGSDAALQAAHGDAAVTLDTVEVPRDKLRGPTQATAASLYWQAGKDNGPMRDYFLLLKDLFHAGVRKIYDAQVTASPRKRIFLTDAFKQPMQGWTNFGFFEPTRHWPAAYPETLAGSGSMGVADLLDHPGCGGLVTPIDYQLRGVGGITEPEGCADSVALRGKYFLAECDIRTFNDDVEKGSYGTAKDIREFAAINYRNIASGLTRGYNPYWMDLVGDWFNHPDIHAVIGRSVDLLRRAVDWPHETPPCIAMVLDDAASLDTNGTGNFFNEAIMTELKLGLSRCGVPYRIYLLEDLARDNFPAHKLFYFPNLFRVTEAKLQLLKRKVLRNGNVVVWGPGSGISDGEKIGVESASRLTGFAFDLLPLNFPRRTQITQFEHAITRGLPADTIYGSPLAYGPVIYPMDGTLLGISWTKAGKYRPGLAVKAIGTGAEAWTSVFTTAVPLPANLWRNLARVSGTHVYCESNDHVLADSSVVALHSIQSGPKTLHLPRRCTVEDAITREVVARDVEQFSFELKAPETRLFHLRV